MNKIIHSTLQIWWKTKVLALILSRKVIAYWKKKDIFVD